MLTLTFRNPGIGTRRTDGLSRLVAGPLLSRCVIGRHRELDVPKGRVRANLICRPATSPGRRDHRSGQALRDNPELVLPQLPRPEPTSPDHEEMPDHPAEFAVPGNKSLDMDRYLVIGDVHGCLDSLKDLLARNPDGRQVVFVGDLTDRGPDSVGVLRLVMQLVREGSAIAVRGNHDDKLARMLGGAAVRVTHGLETTVAELEQVSEPEQREFAAFLGGLPLQAVLDEGRLLVVHAAAPEGWSGKRARAAALFGVTNGQKDENDLPVRVDWAESYRGKATVVHGHTVVPQVTEKNGVWCIDTGAAFGGPLSGLLYPEREVVRVPGNPRPWSHRRHW